MITQQSVQQIFSHIDILDIVGDFVRLKRRGSNYLGLCPFHNEKTPSFTVSPSKEIFKCFGCGKSGNAITFLMDHEKLSYPEALRWLAKRYNIEVEETSSDPLYKEKQQTADSLYILNQFAQKFFEEELWNTDDGKIIAQSYLKERGFTPETIKKFQLGFAPASRDKFVQTATKNQFNPDLLVQSGLAVQRDDGLRDNYRERIIFPVHNHIGKILGFGARLLKTNERAPKYINTPENEVYIKSKILYGLYFARTHIEQKNECLLVEGYTDVMGLHQAGVENVVASGGTSLTTEQLHLIKRFTKNLTILYDADSAGIKAALRGQDLALAEGLYVQLVLLPQGHDPDSFVKEYGGERLSKYIDEHKKDFILFQAEIALQEAGNDSRKKSELINRIAESISRIDKAEDFSRQQDYTTQAAQLLKIDEEGLINLVNKFIRDRLIREERRKQTAAQPEIPKEEEAGGAELLDMLIDNELQERGVVKCLLAYGLMPVNEQETVAQYIFRKIELFDFSNSQLYQIISLYKDWYEAGMEPNGKTFIYYPNEELSRLTISLFDFPYEISSRWEKFIRTHEYTELEISLEETINTLDHFQLRKLIKALQQNEAELKSETSIDMQLSLLEIRKELKAIQMEITQRLGTVIVK